MAVGSLTIVIVRVDQVAPRGCAVTA